MKDYEENWSAKTRDHLGNSTYQNEVKEIDQDIVIKMFMANQNGLQILQKI